MFLSSGAMVGDGVAVSEPPPSPRPRTPGPPIGVAASPSSMPSTAATQLVSRGESSPPPLTIDASIDGPFMLCSPSGGLLRRCEPSDLWGLLISEHTTLNCTYSQTTVRVGRAGDCDTILRDPRVSSTHFTISLELEPHGGCSNGHRRRGTDTEEKEEEVDSNLVHESLNTMHTTEPGNNGNGVMPPSLSLAEDGRPALCGASVHANPTDGPDVASPGALVSSLPPRTEPSLPRWRVRRVLLTDRSANGTYVNDVLVGRGETCELHYGDDISIVRVSEKKRTRGHPTTTATPTESSDEDVAQAAPSHVAGGDALLRGVAAAPPRFRSVPGAAPGRRGPNDLCAKASRRGSDDDDDEGDEEHPPGADGPHVTQLFTALLSTLSTEHMYVERFCFHLYHAEEVGRSGAPAEGAADSRGGLDADGVHRDGWRQHRPPVQAQRTPSRREGGAAPPRPLSPASLHARDEFSNARVSHHKSVRFPDDPVTAFNSPPQTSFDALESPPVPPSSVSEADGRRRRSQSSSSLPPLAPVTANIAAGTVPSPQNSTDARSRASSVASSRGLSSVVTPHSLLRPRLCISESFIAPITLPDREGSTASSNGSAHGAAAAAAAAASSSAASRFHESIGIGPALQRRVAAKRALTIRRRGSGSSDTSSQTTSSFGAATALMRDVPADIPIRYAVLPLRHLQWGGRIGFGASGEVFMGIDVSTATVVAIKVLKGAPLFHTASQNSGTAASSAYADKIGQANPRAAMAHDDGTILALSNVSLGHNGTAPASRVSSEAASSVSTPSASPTPGSKPGTGANEESLQVSTASASTTPSSSSSASATAERHASTTLVRNAAGPHGGAGQPDRQSPPSSEGRNAASPLLRKHLREIIFLTTLQHHRIVRFLGFQFSGEGRLCLLMEYVAGGTLQTLIKNFGAFEENVIRLYALQILEGLQYLTRKGVVHGDLKSANILVSEQSSVKLTDFGTSRFLRACAADDATATADVAADDDVVSGEGRRQRQRQQQQQQQQQRCGTARQAVPPRPPRHSRDGAEEDSVAEVADEEVSVAVSDESHEWSSCRSVEEDSSDDISGTEDESGAPQRVLCGTPLYMSPELIRTQEPTFASDMWALGCVVYEMATGGVLPWRPVHNLSAPAVIWHIGQRYEDGDGPSLDDVYDERERLNRGSGDLSPPDAESSASDDERSQVSHDAHDELCGRRGRGSGSSGSLGRWSRTPTPMLVDLLRSTLNMDAALRPTPTELLQHPFIRNEASRAALERWHTMVIANRHRAVQAPASCVDGEAVTLTATATATATAASSAHMPAATDPEVAARTVLRSVHGSSADSPFDTAVVVARSGRSNTTSREGSQRSHASLSPARTSPPPQRTHSGEVAVSAAAAATTGHGTDASPSSQPHHDQVPPLRHPPPVGELTSSPSTGARSSGSARPSAHHLLGASWEEVESFTLSPPPLPPAAAVLPQPQAQKATPASQCPSVLGAGNPDSQPLFSEPPRRPDARWRPREVPPPAMCPANAAPVLSSGAAVGAPAGQWMGPQSFSAPPRLPVPRSRAAGAAAGAPEAEACMPYSMPEPQSNSHKSYLRQHQLFLKQNELERRRRSLSAPQNSRQIRGRFRTEGPTPFSPPPPPSFGVSLAAAAAAAAGAVPMYMPGYPAVMQQQQQQPVLNYAPGYSDYNLHVNTQTVEMRLPPGFASQPLSTPSQRGKRQQGSGSGVMGGVRLSRIPSSQPLSQTQQQQQQQQQQQRGGSRRDRARGGGAAAVGRSPPLHPHSHNSGNPLMSTGTYSVMGPAEVVASCANSGPVLSSMPSQQFTSSQPAAGGLTMEMDKLTLSSPQSAAVLPPVPNFGSPMAPLQVHGLGYALGYGGAAVSASQPLPLQQGPVLPPPPPPPPTSAHSRGHHGAHTASKTGRHYGCSVNSGDSGSGTTQQSQSATAAATAGTGSGEVAGGGAGAAQGSARKGRHGRRATSPVTGSSTHGHGRLRASRQPSSRLRHQHQLNLARIRARVAEHGDKQQQQQPSTQSPSNDNAVAPQQQHGEQCTPSRVQAALPEAKTATRRTASSTRHRLRTSSRLSTRAASRQQQQQRRSHKRQRRHSPNATTKKREKASKEAES
ncbi:protein kinase [Novymonas esmeraldas]|uniref:non-specific serine/threonine protein kinase n=1 Tax=Novymonas esmeraldas TaxID=1808958 RepID=A0AAW0EV02_9TRYP